MRVEARRRYRGARDFARPDGGETSGRRTGGPAHGGRRHLRSLRASARAARSSTSRRRIEIKSQFNGTPRRLTGGGSTARDAIQSGRAAADILDDSPQP